MTDVVVTVPRWFGLDQWIEEGDPAGALRWSGIEWHFYLYGTPPDIQPGERVYVVFNNVIRGYAPFVRTDFFPGRKYGLVRHGGAVAISLPFPTPGFQGYQYRFWDRSQELPFPDWQKPYAALFDRRVPRSGPKKHSTPASDARARQAVLFE